MPNEGTGKHMRSIMRKYTLTKRLLTLVFLGSVALTSYTNPKNSNLVITNIDTTAVANIESNAGPSYPDITLVAHLGNDTDFLFLISEDSQPYMTININMNGEIMAYWGSVEKRIMQFCLSIESLKQTILERFNAGDTPKDNEMFHVTFDISTSKSVLLALKEMFLEIDIHQCELTYIRNHSQFEGKVPPPPQAVTQAEVINIVEDDTEIEETTIVYSEDQAEFVEITNDVPIAVEETEKDVFKVVEQQPEFPGGWQELGKYLQKNLKYPKSCKKEGIEGRVIVQFVVNKDGSISDASIVKSVDPRLDAEALRIVNAMPNWTPGKQKGEQVRVRFTFPVNFRL